MKRNRSPRQKKTKNPPKTKPPLPPPELDPGMTAFFEELKRRRTEAGMTQDQMAERAELTPNYIGTVENGYRDPPLSTLMALAKGLGCELGALFGAQAPLSPLALEMATLFVEAPPAVQASILKLMRALEARQRQGPRKPTPSGRGLASPPPNHDQAPIR